MRSWRIRTAALGWALLALSPSPSLMASESSKPAPKPAQAIKLALPDRGPRHAGFYMALEKGYFQDAGINLELEESPNPIASLVKGGAAYAVGGVEALVYQARGLPIVSIAAVFQHSPASIVGRAEKVPDIASLSGTLVHQEKEQPFIEAFLKAKQIKPILKADKASIRTFLQGASDAVMVGTADDLVSLQNGGHPVVVLSPRLAEVDAYGDILLTRTDLLEADKKSVRAFREAALKGWKYALANPNEALDLIEKKYPTNRPRSHGLQELALISQLIQADLVELGHQDMARWEQVEKIFLEAGILKSPADVNPFIFDPNRERLPEWARYALLIGLPALLVILVLILGLRSVTRRLAASEEEQARSLNALKAQALWDGVSELNNQRYFEPNLERELVRARRKRDPVALVMADIDLLKWINERWGNASGDEAMKCVARLIRKMAREEEMVCRYENAEMVVMLPHKSLEKAREFAEALRERVESTSVTAQNGEPFFITVSAGVAVWPDLAGTAKGLVESARRAMYAAKSAGRNRVAVAHAVNYGAK